jgi:adenylate cyclase, class 2
MSHINIEIKAHCPKPERVRDFLIAHNAEAKGIDRQTDTYFHVPNGRLKLREGNIENNLIFYQRPDQSGPKKSDFILTPVTDAAALKASLTAALGVKVVVEKQREIYFIENVKFHIDHIAGLGDFVEIEASNKANDLPVERLEEQCNFYLQAFGIEENHLCTHSYSDMLSGA